MTTKLSLVLSILTLIFGVFTAVAANYNPFTTLMSITLFVSAVMFFELYLRANRA